MKTSDFSNIQFNEEELEIYFDYKRNRYLLIIDFDEDGYLLPTLFHETHYEVDGREVYKCYHCSSYITTSKEVRKGRTHYSISPYSNICMYLNPIADKVMKSVFQNEKIKVKAKDWLNKIK